MSFYSAKKKIKNIAAFLIILIFLPYVVSIFVNGKEVTIRSPKDSYELGIGMVHQHFKLVDVLTAAENIVLGLPGKGKLDMKRITEDIQKLADKYGFELDLSQKIYEMSVSQKQTVEIIKMLYRGARILILDEPTIAQDVRGRRRIAEIVRTLSQRGKLVLAILHDMDFVAECFERVIVMAQGRVVAEGTPRRVFSDAEALQAARLDPPHVTQLCTRLGYEGVFLTVEEFLHACGRD